MGDGDGLGWFARGGDPNPECCFPTVPRFLRIHSLEHAAPRLLPEDIRDNQMALGSHLGAGYRIDAVAGAF